MSEISARRIGGLDLAQVGPGTDRALRDVVRRNEAQRGDGVLVARLRRGLASRERLLEESLERGASIEGGGGEQPKRLNSMDSCFRHDPLAAGFSGERESQVVLRIDEL